MSNIYLKLLKVTIEKKWRAQNFNFVTIRTSGKLQLTQILLNFQTSGCNLKIRGFGAKLCAAFLLF